MPLPEDLNDDCFSPSFGWCQWCITNSADMSEWQVVFLLDDQDVSKTCFKHYFWNCIKYVNNGHCKVFFALWKGVIVLKEKGTRKCIEIFFFTIWSNCPFLTAESLLKCFVYKFVFFLLFTYWIHVSFNETDSNK